MNSSFKSSMFFRKEIVAVSSIIIIWLLFNFVGIRGVDFGRHWDDWIIRERIQSSIHFGKISAGEYSYPGFLHKVGLISLVYDVLKTFPNSVTSIKDHLQQITYSHAFHMRLRSLSNFISSFSIFWVFLLIFLLRRNWWESVLAGALLSGSWEISYHSRWLAADAPLMQFGALFLLIFSYSWQSPHIFLILRWCAFVAGIACGTKYPGGALIIPLFLTLVYYKVNFIGWEIFFKESLFHIMYFLVGFLITTPGALVEPNIFWSNVNYIKLSYSTGFLKGNRPSLVVPGIEHFLLILKYIGTTLFSKYLYISIFFTVMAIVGLINLLKENLIKGCIILSFPVFYLIYFSMQKVFIVRNLIILSPFLVFFAMKGYFWIMDFLSRTKRPKLKILFTVTIGCFLIANLHWNLMASSTIVQRGRVNLIQQCGTYLKENPKKLFWVSDRVYKELSKLEEDSWPNITSSNTAETWASIFYLSESTRWKKRIVAVDPFFLIKWFGPHEVNLSIYSNFPPGNERIIVMNSKKARRLDILPWNRTAE